MLSRSLLFVPADKEKMILKINSLKADAIILDLEDAIAIPDKQLARDLVKEHFHIIKKPTIIRINSIDTEAFHEDLKLVQELATSDYFKGIILPKAEDKETILQVAEQLKEIENARKLSHRISMIPLIESARGVMNSFEIASADERISRLSFGGVDFVKDIDATPTKSEVELLYARSQIIISSRSAQLEKPIDTVYVDIKNEDGFRINCENVKKLGFGGKLLIHPRQIDGANLVFSPSETEVKEAKEIMEGLEINDHAGVFQHNGKMIDKPVVDRAKQTLETWKTIKEYEEGEDVK